MYKKNNLNDENRSSLADMVGNTPLVRLSKMGVPPKQSLFGKCEFMNPGGSVKDRIAFHMIEKAEATGLLQKGQLLVEATGGNTGIGLALAARLKGYRLLCVMTEKVGQEKLRMMQILGAETLVLPGGKSICDPDHFLNQARRIAEERDAWFVDQFNNRDNLEAHYKFTGPEIWEQCNGKIDALVAGIGTGGTLCGTGKFLKEKNPRLKLVLADPVGSHLAAWQKGKEAEAGSYLVEGIGGDYIPGIVDINLIDEAFYISDELSVKTTHALLAKEALFVGGSSGCIVAAALEFLKNSKQQEALSVVAILPSSGKLYTKTIFDSEWLGTKSISL